jgi:hypothetical protein
MSPYPFPSVLRAEERKMDEQVFERLLRVQTFERMLREGKITAEDVLRKTPAERVDGMMQMLLRHLPHDEVRRALYEQIRDAPLADFDTLRMAYFKHFEHAPAISVASRRSVLHQSSWVSEPQPLSAID